MTYDRPTTDLPRSYYPPDRSPVIYDHVFYLATNKHLKYETQGEVVSLA